MKKKGRNKQSFGQWVGVFLYMLIGAVCGLLYMRYMVHAADTGMSRLEHLLMIVYLFAFIYIAVFLQIIIHESGHLVFGLLSGYRFSSFRIAGFMWSLENGRIKCHRLSIAGTGGQCLMVPPDLQDGRIPVMLYNYGGSLMNLIFSAFFLVLSFLCPAYSPVRMFMEIAAWIGAAFALMNGLPLRMGPVNNDGKNALDLSRSPEATRAFWIQLKANEMSSEGVRLKDMPDEWFTVPTDESMKNGIIASLGVIACNRLMDQHRFTEADTMMEHLLSLDSGIVGLNRSLLICDRMYVELITENRSDVLLGMLTQEQKKIMKSMNKYPSVLRTEYVYSLLSEKDKEKAEKIRAQFEKNAKTYPYAAEIKAEREFMEIADHIQFDEERSPK